jgi:hypothetical protein
MPRTITIVFIAVLCFCNCMEAQDKPDLSGTWKLNLAKSDYGDTPGPSRRTDTIEQRGETISESVVSEYRNKPQRYTLAFSTDGKKKIFSSDARVNVGSTTLRSISASWQGRSLVVTEILNFQDFDLPAENTYTLSGDGSTLTIAVSLGGGDTAFQFVFDRVP